MSSCDDNRRSRSPDLRASPSGILHRMIIAIVPLLIAVLGLLIYVLASNAKVVEVGRALMWCGILVTLLAAMSRVIKIG